MADRPILFSGAMIRAIRAGRKTQTRRLFNLPKWAVPGTLEIDDDGLYACAEISGCLAKVPTRINVGDRLWVRETWSHTGDHVFSISEARLALSGWPIYQADDNPEFPHAKFWPSIHMPREFSRLTLTVTDVKVERLQDCSEADAIAEGIEPHHSGWMPYNTAFYEADGVTPANCHPDPRDSYRQLWNTINRKAPWEANPWVAAYTFTVEQRNIDRIARAA